MATALPACAPTTKASIKKVIRNPTFEPGYDLQAKVVILAEGPRGSLTKQLIQKFDLAKNANPQTYGVGVKELWEVPAGTHRGGRSDLHHGLAADHERIRRRLDLRLER